MTEDEAKTKWCPFVRFHGTPSDDCVPNRSGSFSDTTRCLGSECMAWREKKVWQAPEVRTSKNPAEDAVLVVIGGYCGLAGEPK